MIFKGKHGPLLIAEIGGNLECNFDYALKLTKLAIESNVDVIKSLMRLGVMATVNEIVEFDVAAKVAASFEIGVLKPKDKEDSLAAKKTGINYQELITKIIEGSLGKK